MSTKSTLTYGENFHLYLDYEDARTGVWLEINQPHDTVAAGYAGIVAQTTVRIPLAIWEHIRQHTPSDYSLADLTEAELLAKAESTARENRERYRQALATEKSAQGQKSASLGFWRFHGYHRPLAWQTARNLDALRKEQADQRELRAAVETIARYASPEAARARQAALSPLVGLGKKRKLPPPKSR